MSPGIRWESRDSMGGEENHHQEGGAAGDTRDTPSSRGGLAHAESGSEWSAKRGGMAEAKGEGPTVSSLRGEISSWNLSHDDQVRARAPSAAPLRAGASGFNRRWANLHPFCARSAAPPPRAL